MGTQHAAFSSFRSPEKDRWAALPWVTKEKDSHARSNCEAISIPGQKTSHLWKKVTQITLEMLSSELWTWSAGRVLGVLFKCRSLGAFDVSLVNGYNFSLKKKMVSFTTLWLCSVGGLSLSFDLPIMRVLAVPVLKWSWIPRDSMWRPNYLFTLQKPWLFHGCLN